MTHVLLYGSESWTISSRMKRRLEAIEMWFYRRMLRISWTQHVSNYEVLRRMQTRTYYEKGGPGESDTYRTDRGRERHGKTARNILDWPERMDDREGHERSGESTPLESFEI